LKHLQGFLISKLVSENSLFRLCRASLEATTTSQLHEDLLQVIKCNKCQCVYIWHHCVNLCENDIVCRFSTTVQ